MARITNKDEIITDIKDGAAGHLKLALLLTGAHTAALGYCIKALSDGRTGLGLLTAIFGVGFIAGAVNYAGAYFSSLVSTNAIREDRDPNDEPGAGFLKLATWRSLWISGLALVAGVLVFIVKVLFF